jgi:cytochrome c-type biogenesis protein CcmH
MLLWIIFATLTAGVIAFVLAPLIRPRATAPAASVTDVYKDQLKEIETQLMDGLIGHAEGEAAKAEIGRRLLAADAAVTGATVGDRVIAKQTLRGITFGVAGGVTLLSLGLYLWLGSPDLPDQPRAEREDVRQAVEIQRMIRQIEERVAADPNDVRGRQILARVYVSEGRLQDAAALYDSILGIVAANPGVLESFAAEGKVTSSQAEASLMAETAATHLFENSKSERAKTLLAQALIKNPKDSLARHLSAEMKFGAGDVTGAIADWKALARDMKPDEPIRPMVEERLRQATSQSTEPKPQ